MGPYKTATFNYFLIILNELYFLALCPGACASDFNFFSPLNSGPSLKTLPEDKKLLKKGAAHHTQAKFRRQYPQKCYGTQDGSPKAPRCSTKYTRGPDPNFSKNS
jgi:hypothetical protein